MAPNKRRHNAEASRISSKRKKAGHVESIGRVVADVARIPQLSLQFSTASSPASSEITSPVEERAVVPESVSTVPELGNQILGNNNYGQEWVVPENGEAAVNEQQRDQSIDNGNDQGDTIILDGTIQESVVEVGGQEPVEAEQEVLVNPSSATLIAASHELPMNQAPSQQPQQVVLNPNPSSAAPLVQPISQNQEDDEDPWVAALDDIAPASTRSGFVTITHNIPRFSSYEIDMMEDLKLPDDVTAIEYPRIGNVQLLKLVDETTKIYDGLDLMDGRFVTVRQLERPKHMRRLRLACRLSLILGDFEEYKRIYELLVPAKTTFELFKEKTTEGEMKLYYYWIEPPNHGSLHAYVIERKRLPEIQSKEYFRQIAQIVEFCHARGVIIRDLKLRKFVFADARRQTIKLDDLDETAICPENKSDPDLIDYDKYDVDDDRLCDRHGCPAYVSPEILDLSKKWYSGRASDVWSLGVLLYVLLVGRYPFYDVTPAGLFSKIRQGRIHLTDQDGVRLEARLLIRSMLRRDPKERPCVTEVLAHPWLQPKDYRASFKVFDSSECVFWKSPSERNSGGPTAGTSGQTITIVNALARISSSMPPQHSGPRVPQQQRDVSGSAKVMERINANINGNRHGGGY